MRRMPLRAIAYLLTFGGLAVAQGDSPGLNQRASVVIKTAAQANLESARILIDNQQAFLSKIDLIKSARKSIRLAYYIFSDDETSSYLTQLLIEKATQQGVKVDLLVDLNTNYPRMDLFRLLEQKGNGNIRVRYYNRPTPAIIRDITFMTATCASEKHADESACRADRKAQADRAFEEAQAAARAGRAANPPFMTQLFLAGLYAKNGGALQMSLAFGTGADLEEIKKQIKESAGSSSPEDMEQLKSLLHLMFQAKVKGSLQAKLQLAAAMGLYGQQIEPILKMFDKAVPDTMRDQFANHDDWVHVTDFLHHKFLLVDDQYLQIGGRNIENSYHLNRIAGTGGKYIFRDTDLAVKLKSADGRLGASFDRLFNFKSLVTTTQEIQTEFRFDLIAQSDAVMAQMAHCQQDAAATDKISCISKAFAGVPSNEGERLSKAERNMMALSQSNLTREVLGYSGSRFAHFTEALADNDIAASYLAYVENLPYDKNGPANPTQRLYFQAGHVSASEQAKHIHAVVAEGIKKVCSDATRAFSSAKDKAAFLRDPSNRRRIVIHQGYTIFPAEILALIGKAVNTNAVNGGSWDMHCPNVQFEVLTNSIPTTDLSVINLFAGLQIGSLVNQQRKSMAMYQSVSDELVKARLFPPAEIRYFEFQPPRSGAGLDTESLHTKVFAFDQLAMFIGSANADVRSYYMDTNNGIFIGNAANVNRKYFAWLDSQKTPDATGGPYYVELTESMAQEARVLDALDRGDEATTKKARLDALKTYFQIEVEKVAGHFEKKWRDQVASATPEERQKVEERIAKMRHYLPTVAGAIATVNLYVYEVSQDLIAQRLDQNQLTEMGRAFNLRFELL